MSLFDQMVNRYAIKTEDERRNAIHEVMQEITLAGLYRGGFFDKAAFYEVPASEFSIQCHDFQKTWTSL